MGRPIQLQVRLILQSIFKSIYNCVSQKAFGLIIHYMPDVERLKKFSIFALDDIQVTPGACAHQYDYIYTFANNFEDLDMDYVQPLTNSIGYLVTPRFGHPPDGAPTFDHTTNSDAGTYFLFMNRYHSTANLYVDTIAILNLSQERTLKHTCVRFAYQISGNATLRVFSMAVDSYNYQLPNSIWHSIWHASLL